MVQGAPAIEQTWHVKDLGLAWAQSSGFGMMVEDDYSSDKTIKIVVTSYGVFSF
jgi:hypothetical protein